MGEVRFECAMAFKDMMELHMLKLQSKKSSISMDKDVQVAVDAGRRSIEYLNGFIDSYNTEGGKRPRTVSPEYAPSYFNSMFTIARLHSRIADAHALLKLAIKSRADDEV